QRLFRMPVHVCGTSFKRPKLLVKRLAKIKNETSRLPHDLANFGVFFLSCREAQFLKSFALPQHIEKRDEMMTEPEIPGFH
ncbi:MAG: hypothetical protein WBY66_16200, partial [Candidatus Acidiferrales bacterium]